MTPLLRHLHSAVAGLVDLALPATCAGCGARGVLLCPSCSAALGGPARLAWPDPVPAGLPAPWAVAAYDGAVRAAVVAHKEEGRLALARLLGESLARSAAAAAGADGGRPLLLVPAPSRRAAVRARGHDPTLRTARRAAVVLRRTGRATTVLPVLRVPSGVVDQAGLTARERAENLTGALRVPSRFAGLVAGRRLVVVDDVVTTGATLAEAARALRAAGARVEAVAVVAATSRRTPARSHPAGVLPGAAGD